MSVQWENLDEICKENLLVAISKVADAESDGYVSGLFFALSEFTGLYILNGHFITFGVRQTDRNKNKLGVMIQIVMDESKTLAVCCKKNVDLDIDIEAFSKYMQDGNFPNGLLMYPKETIQFTLDLSLKNAHVIQKRTLNNFTDYRDIFDIIYMVRNFEQEENGNKEKHSENEAT
ncbi:hypothetical protein BB558_005865 [Smittium angustum]|uniref:Uncharacterized protein n=1 Tax=Smittium angustum TaxID=133377 RepID=A0A2U1IZ86_SMIAN|nr:hypothetical protein BB558_005865 [Smittium angustum]